MARAESCACVKKEASITSYPTNHTLAEALHAYIAADLHLLVEALRPSPQPGDIDLVVGIRGPLATPDMCNGLLVPIVAFDQVYSFDRDSLIGAIPKPDKTPADKFKVAAGEVFDRIMQLTDNAGATDEHRALNYLTVRYPAIYSRVSELTGAIFRSRRWMSIHLP